MKSRSDIIYEIDTIDKKLRKLELIKDYGSTIYLNSSKGFDIILNENEFFFIYDNLNNYYKEKIKLLTKELYESL